MGGLSRDWRVRGAGTSLGMREATRGLGRLGIREFRVPRPFLLRVSSEKASFAKQARGQSIHVHSVDSENGQRKQVDERRVQTKTTKAPRREPRVSLESLGHGFLP